MTDRTEPDPLADLKADHEATSRDRKLGICLIIGLAAVALSSPVRLFNLGFAPHSKLIAVICLVGGMGAGALFQARIGQPGALLQTMLVSVPVYIVGSMIAGTLLLPVIGTLAAPVVTGGAWMELACHALGASCRSPDPFATAVLMLTLLQPVSVPVHFAALRLRRREAHSLARLERARAEATPADAEAHHGR
ncbi:hypothetical protein [Tropicimonas sediminicola]|uniref:Uncharacterized protein n=1 Tax=Tropicimonas sediminicola TaxID=1031541 RepID=A0A239GTC1_9RHOB|nr:hypothetical protein [Tropicimonas sediminicola]SNS72380.1 hypothetical protein SAMN05421757_10397 [Tropicimonas sediminicola]